MSLPVPSGRAPSIALLLLTLAGSGCSASSENAASSDPACDRSAVTPVHPPADAKATVADVQPILARSCALGGCHVGAAAAGDLSFPLSSNRWRDNVVGQRSHENPSLLLVEPGNPDRSWLMQKLTGEFCTAGNTCDPHLGCGQRMPFGDALSALDLTTVFVWIRSGALP